MIAAMLVGGPLSDKLGRRKVFVFASSVVVAAALVVPLVMPTFTGWLIFTLVAGLGFGMFQSVDQALMSEVLPSKDSYAKDLGVVNIAATLPQTLAPAVGGAIVLALRRLRGAVPGGHRALAPRRLRRLAHQGGEVMADATGAPAATATASTAPAGGAASGARTGAPRSRGLAPCSSPA